MRRYDCSATLTFDWQEPDIQVPVFPFNDAAVISKKEFKPRAMRV